MILLPVYGPILNMTINTFPYILINLRIHVPSSNKRTGPPSLFEIDIYLFIVLLSLNKQIKIVVA